MNRHYWLIGGGLALAIAALFIFKQPASAPPAKLNNSATTPSSDSYLQHPTQPTPEINEYQPHSQTLDQMWDRPTNWTATLSAERTRTLIVTGDVLTARSVNAYMTAQQNFLYPWVQTAERLRQADLTYINLETPLIPNCPIKNDGMIFCGDTANIAGLQFAGVDVVNLANNHMGNQGLAGVTSTVETLQQAGLITAGVSDPVYVEVKGKKWAFLGYNEVDQQVGIQLSEEALIRQQVQEARKNADVVIVQFHWGVEYRYQPTEHQRLLATIAIDNGADLIIGNHPHWFQALEMYNNKLITYSHGNFIFDQMWSQQTREGLVGKYTFYDNTLVDVEYWPVWIEQYGQPRWLEGQEKINILDALRHETEVLQQRPPLQ